MKEFSDILVMKQDHRNLCIKEQKDKELIFQFEMSKHIDYLKLG